MLQELHFGYMETRSEMTLIIRDDYSNDIVELTWRMDDLLISALFKEVLELAQKYVRL